MAKGLALVSSSALFFKNCALGALLSLVFRMAGPPPRWGPRSRAPILAFGLVLIKELVEIFIDGGTAAISDAAAGLAGGCAASAVLALRSGARTKAA